MTNEQIIMAYMVAPAILIGFITFILTRAYYRYKIQKIEEHNFTHREIKIVERNVQPQALMSQYALAENNLQHLNNVENAIESIHRQAVMKLAEQLHPFIETTLTPHETPAGRSLLVNNRLRVIPTMEPGPVVFANYKGSYLGMNREYPDLPATVAKVIDTIRHKSQQEQFQFQRTNTSTPVKYH